MKETTLLGTDVGAILDSSLSCNGSRFDCGIAEVRISRAMLITFYFIELVLTFIASRGLKRKALLQWAVFSITLLCISRIALFALPFYYTVEMMRKKMTGLILFLDILPEGLFFVAVLFFYLSFNAFLKALSLIRRTSADIPQTTSKNHVRLTMIFSGLIIVLAIIGCGFVTQLAFRRDEDYTHWFYLRMDPILDSVFICFVSVILEIMIICIGFLNPIRLKTTLLLSLLPLTKGLYGTIEWIIWPLPNLTWMFLWILYFVITDLVQMTSVLVILIVRSTKSHQNRRSSTASGVTEQHPLLYS